MPSHHIEMSDQDLQLLEQARLRMGLVTIEQTVETLARIALLGSRHQACNCQCRLGAGPAGEAHP